VAPPVPTPLDSLLNYKASFLYISNSFCGLNRHLMNYFGDPFYQQEVTIIHHTQVILINEEHFMIMLPLLGKW